MTENEPTGSDDRTDRSRASADGDSGGASDAGGEPENDGESESESGRRDVVSYLEWGAVAGLGLVALVAVFRFYFAASRTISIWINPDFEPVFQAAFNLVVLLCAAAGIVVFARRLR